MVSITDFGMDDMLNMVIAIVLVASIAAIGAVTLSGIRDTQTDKTGITNETLAGTETLPKTMTTNSTPIVEDSETIRAWNTTTGAVVGGALVEGTNYSVLSYDNGQFNITNVNPNGSDIAINISYTHKASNNETALFDKGQEGLTTFADFLPTIATVVVGVILLGLLFVLKGRKGRSGSV